MPRQKKYIPAYLSFTRKERMGILAILLLVLLFTILPFLFPFFIRSKPVDHSAFEKEIARLNIKEMDSAAAYQKNYDNDAEYMQYPLSEKKQYNRPAKGELFYFDPNTLPVDGWVRLGIREKTANTIKNYLSKGGRFYKPEDIAAIWGLHEDEVKRLLPYIKIEVTPVNGMNKYPGFEKNKNYEKPKLNMAAVDVNNADTSAFIALPGIGSKLAARIIAFREKLGGFYKTEQVAETYGLPDSSFQKIKNKLVITGSYVKKLNINTATVDELKAHPYLRYNLANALVQYRNQHGSFSLVSDIKKILLVTEDIYNRVAPYLTVNN
jgi:competence ComEA-like helix-hairpin-helix protein